jgi:hypothetical protein
MSAPSWPAPFHCTVKVTELKPQQDPVAVGLVTRITDGSVVVLNVPVVQLED